jgi:hypothetical protein
MVIKNPDFLAKIGIFLLTKFDFIGIKKSLYSFVKFVKLVNS